LAHVQQKHLCDEIKRSRINISRKFPRFRDRVFNYLALLARNLSRLLIHICPINRKGDDNGGQRIAQTTEGNIPADP
jgi:hypothetical protein